jgi:hypothetical protein
MLFTACKQEENDSVFIAVDYSQDLVGTWTCLAPNYAEALVIKEDGTTMSSGIEDYEMWKNVKGSVKTINNKMIMTFEDGDNFEGRFEIVPGIAFSIFNEEGERLTYSYCKHDISKDVLGVWVCNDTPDVSEKDMAIASYTEDDRAIYTGIVPGGDSYGVNYEQDYTVVDDMMFRRIVTRVGVSSEGPKYVPSRLTYTPNGTSFGDILTERMYVPTEDGDSVEEKIFSWLRVKQTLSLQEKKYAYSNLYISSVKGKDEDINFNGYTFNFANMDGEKLDKMLKALLFDIEFSNNQTIQYSYRYNDVNVQYDAPIIVEGNKMILDMKSKNPAFRNVELYTFQDADDSQMHIYMPTEAFIDFFGNMELAIRIESGSFNENDTAAIEEVYSKVDEIVDSINLSFIFKSVKK